MLHLAQKVAGAPVSGTDGDIGKLEDFYFDESGWNVRYLVVNTDEGNASSYPSPFRRAGAEPVST